MKSLVKCHCCSKEFLKLNYQIGISKNHYCSNRCVMQFRWRNHTKNVKTCQLCSGKIHKDNKKNICISCLKNNELDFHSPETRKVISEKRKEYLLNNPDKHPWRSKDKFKSVPCENFKKILVKHDYLFIEEFKPSSECNFSIDISFPEKMIGIEINGNQHYERNGKLKEYYQKRHDYIESLGWKLYEIHYSLCFDEDYILKLIEHIIKSENKIEFNHEEYIKNKIDKTNYDLCKCGSQKYFESAICKLCYSLRQRKVIRPTKEELHYLIWNYPTFDLSKMFKVSDKAIEKWCKNYKINKPPRGYWQKLKSKKIIDYSI